MNDHDYAVTAYNRTTSKVDTFIKNRAQRRDIIGTHSIEEPISALKRPRRIMLVIKAAKAVDLVIDQFLPYAEAGDIIIDGGNSNYQDTMRRTEVVESKGMLFISTGVSGGEEGARHGPSILPDGSPEAWPHVKSILQDIAAKVDGVPCCDWIGEDGAGHYVKRHITALSTATWSWSVRPTSCSSTCWVRPTRRCTRSSPGGTRGTWILT
jgi:6-phosphogluconate dehydrogenase